MTTVCERFLVCVASKSLDKEQKNVPLDVKMNGLKILQSWLTSCETRDLGSGLIQNPLVRNAFQDD